MVLPRWVDGKDELVVAGIMNGTSTDGVDVAVTQIRGSGRDAQVRLLGFSSVPYEPAFRQRLLGLYPPSVPSTREIATLSWELGHLHCLVLEELLASIAIPTASLDLVGYHGVVLFHHDGIHVDIGEPSVIAERLETLVVSELRARDCAAGGEGAPLSPYVDWVLFGSGERHRAIQNVGGIANVTLLPAGGTLDDVISYDTGPGNMIMDALVELMTDGEQTFDQDGHMASQGRVSEELLSQLMRHAYIERDIPKSTGRTDFGRDFAQGLLDQAHATRMSDVDLLATVTRFTAESIVESYERFLVPVAPPAEVICGGGGVHNRFLMDALRERLGSAVVLKTHEDYGIPNDAREALSWAVLASETVRGHPTSIPKATGARKSSVLGKIISP